MYLFQQKIYTAAWMYLIEKNWRWQPSLLVNKRVIILSVCVHRISYDDFRIGVYIVAFFVAVGLSLIMLYSRLFYKVLIKKLYMSI